MQRPPALCRALHAAGSCLPPLPPRASQLRVAARVRRRGRVLAMSSSDAAAAATGNGNGNGPAPSPSAAAPPPPTIPTTTTTIKRPTPPAQRVDLAEPRARPAISTVLYYITLGTYAAFFITTSVAGPDAADAVVLRLANDHAAVADGDVLRLFTSSFAATESLYQLGLYLVAMLTLGAELEGIFGPELFWATYALSAVAGGFADAALPAALTAGADGLPRLVTQGPAPAVAGMVGALLVHTARNWRFESAVESLRKRISENRPLPPWLGLRPLVDVQAGSLAAAIAAADAADNDAGGGAGGDSSSIGVAGRSIDGEALSSSSSSSARSSRGPGTLKAVAAVSKLKPTSTAEEKAAVAAVASQAVADNPLALLPVVVSSFSLSRKVAPVVSPAQMAAAASMASSSMDETAGGQETTQPGVNGPASAAIAAAAEAAAAASSSSADDAQQPSPSPSSYASSPLASGGSLSGSLDGEEDDPLHDEPGGLTTAEVDLFMGYSASFLVPRDVQALVRTAGTGGAALRALVDAFASGGGTDSLSASDAMGDGGVSVAGLAAGALAGCVLGYAFSPTYELARRPIDHSKDEDEEAAAAAAAGRGGGKKSGGGGGLVGGLIGVGGGAAKTKPAASERGKPGLFGGLFSSPGSFAQGLSGSAGKGAKKPAPLFGPGAPEPTADDEVVVVDVRDAERGRAAVGFAALLYVAIAAWLIGPAAYLEG
jgi:membrane associated rhomboid family serine protease